MQALMSKTYQCEKCSQQASYADLDPYFRKRYGNVCLWCADISIDTTRYMGWTQMADAEMGDL